MSEVLSAVQGSSGTPKSGPQNLKAVIISNLMTFLSTVLVAIIAIVPQMQRGDAENNALRQEIAELSKRSAVAPAPSIALDKKMNVRGTAMTLDGKQTLNGFDVYLLPEGNNLLTTKTDDSGRFNLPGIPAGTYSIIIRDSTQGKSGKVLLDEAESETDVKMIGAKIKYLIRQ